MQVLVIEDDPGVGSLLERALSEAGHAVRWVPSLFQARQALSESIDLLVLDRMLPDGDGLDWLRELRASGEARPVLVLTAKDRVDDRVEGLYGGADDYLTKPFAIEEVLARLTALSRRTASAESRIEVDDLVLDLTALRVYRGGEELSLTAQEFRLLRYLVEHRGRVLSRARLLEAVWDTHHDPGTNIVDVYISYLRGKIDKGHPTKLIHTVRGLGYLLEAR